MKSSSWSTLIRLFSLTFLTAICVILAPDARAGGHTNIAHYTFPTTNQFTPDVSTNGNNVNSFGSSGGQYYITNVPEEGPFAAFFTFNHTNAAGYINLPTNLLPTFAGSFTLSLWLKTSDSFGNDTDNGDFNGEGLFSLQFSGGTNNDVIPMSMTGSKLAFLTGGSPHQTLHSTASINTGSYVHVAVTRDQGTGQKKIYVNGALDNTGTGTTNLLNAPTALRVGANFNFDGYNGLIDDIQIYSGVLSAAEIQQIYTNAGVTVPDTSGNTLAEAVDNADLTWTTGGTSNWTFQTTVTHDGVDAAASGTITDSQSTYIQTVVPTNGQVSFFWKVSSEQDFDFLSFYINGVDMDDISGDVDWTQDTFSVSPGDVLRWEYAKDPSGSDGSDRGWLDQVVFTPASPLPPVSATLQLSIQRGQDPFLGGDVFLAFPSLVSVSPSPTTFHSVVSPTGLFFQDENGSTSTILTNLNALINECTNPSGWTLYINKNDVNQQVFNFKVSISGLTTNILAKVQTSPADGAVNIATNSPVQWTGPAGYSSIALTMIRSHVLEGSTNLAGTATNWPSPPTLGYGTNRLEVDYTNNATQVTFTTPTNATSSVSNWVAGADLKCYAVATFVVGAPAPLPVQINTPATQPAPGQFQFSFQTLAGRPHIVEGNTNLTGTNWVVITNFTGDGSTKTLTFPTTNPPLEYFRVRTQ